MALIKGKDLNLYVSTSGSPIPVCHSTDCTLNITADVDETTTRTTGRGKTFDYSGTYSYTLELNGITSFVDDNNLGDFQTAILNGEKMLFYFTDNNDVEYSGTVLIPEVDMDSPVDGMSVFTAQLLGDGELGKTEYGTGSGAIGVYVTIIDQLGNLVAQVQAPGVFNVLRFDRIVQGGAIRNTPDLIIMQSQ